MLVCAAVIPHGDFIADPSLLPDGSHSRAEAEYLRQCAQGVAAKFRSLEVETILLITPHGVSSDEDTVIYRGTRGDGWARIGSDIGSLGWLLPAKNIQLEDDVATELCDALQSNGHKFSGVTLFGGYESVPLRYGEVIPLSFFFRAGESDEEDGRVKVGIDMSSESANDERKGTQEALLAPGTPTCVIVSLANRRYKEGSSMVDEMVQLGSDLSRFVENSVILRDRRVAIVVSADLAHTHEASGPYGFSPSAQKFDDACGAWARTLDESALLATARDLLDQSKSCGYLGLVILHGVLTASNEREDICAATDTWDCRLHSIYHPTYYGMMVASFMRRH